MSILFINASPNKSGNTAKLAKELLAGKEYETLNEVDGNVSYRIYEGGTHGPEASNQYTFNALLWFWND